MISSLISSAVVEFSTEFYNNYLTITYISLILHGILRNLRKRLLIKIVLFLIVFVSLVKYY